MGVKRFVRQGAKSALAGLLDVTGMARLIKGAARKAAGGRRVLIVAFHRVAEDFEREARQAIPGLIISTEAFEAQLDALHRAGFEVVSLAEALQILTGERSARRDAAVITFDDGYGDVHAHALPILRRRGLSATVYLASGCIGTNQPFPHDQLYSLLLRNLYTDAHRMSVPALGKVSLHCAALVERLIAGQSAHTLEALMEALAARTPPITEAEAALASEPCSGGRPLTWDEVRAMSRQGITFGAHTVKHTVLTHESVEAIEGELTRSKAEIEAETGRAVLDFAYPNGLFDARVLDILRRLGFRSAVTTEDAPNRIGIDPLRLRRKTLWENTGRGAFGLSERLARCQLDDLFGLLSLTQPERGLRAVPRA
ncbi:MAG: polysaccharide deacetylase family protein [Myxococcales bacterium]|jgi:peptidoglycan/xylan/chitin deacetylase (PgdA/CDA1 family)|nr:polysaccharide deacetylase family protein [Myxococcales bacterium]